MATIIPLYGASDLTSYGTTSSNSNTAVLNVPANTAVGDLLVAICCNQSTGGTFLWTLPSGWTEAAHLTAGRWGVIATYPIPDSAALAAIASTHTFTITGGGGARMAGVMFRVQGADLTAPVLGASAAAAGTTSSVTVPAFTTAAAGALIAIATTNIPAGSTQPAGSSSTGMTLITEQFGLSAGGGATSDSIFFKLLELETVHAANTLHFSPAAAVNIYGLQIALNNLVVTYTAAASCAVAVYPAASALGQYYASAAAASRLLTGGIRFDSPKTFGSTYAFDAPSAVYGAYTFTPNTAAITSTAAASAVAVLYASASAAALSTATDISDIEAEIAAASCAAVSAASASGQLVTTGSAAAAIATSATGSATSIQNVSGTAAITSAAAGSGAVVYAASAAAAGMSAAAASGIIRRDAAAAAVSVSTAAGAASVYFYGAGTAAAAVSTGAAAAGYLFASAPAVLTSTAGGSALGIEYTAAAAAITSGTAALGFRFIRHTSLTFVSGVSQATITVSQPQQTLTLDMAAATIVKELSL